MSRLLIPVSLLVHCVLVLSFLPPSLIISGDPPNSDDWPLKFTEAYLVADSDHDWGYSVAHLAGYPAGVYTGVGTQAYDYFLLLTKGMLKPGVSFNVFLLLMFTLVPLLPWAAAYIAGLPRRTRTVVILLTLLVWHFESHVHYQWQNGQTTFLTASALAIIVGVLFGVICEATDGMARQFARTVAAGVLAGIAVNFHPLGGFVLACLCGGPVIFAMARFKGLALVLMGAATTIAVILNLHWLLPFIYLKPECYVGGAPGPFQTGLKTFLFDMLSDRSFRKHFDTTVLLQGVLFLAATGLVRGKGMVGNRWNWILALIGLTVISYLGSYSEFVKELQPYRYVGALLLASLLPAAVLIDQIWEEPRTAFRQSPIIFFGLLALVIPRLTPAVLEVLAGKKLVGLDSDERRFVEWATANTDSKSRIMFDQESEIIADLLPPLLKRETIGGPYEHVVVAMRYVMINQDGRDPRFHWFGKPVDELTTDEVVERLKLLNVEWYVVRANSKWDRFAQKFPAVFTPVINLGKLSIYQYRGCDRNFFLAGSGEVVASTNELALTNLKPGKVTLKYHYLSTMRAEGVELRGEPQLGNPVGFISFDLPTGVTALSIRNSYSFKRE
jgi:hypothetical protein